MADKVERPARPPADAADALGHAEARAQRRVVRGVHARAESEAQRNQNQDALPRVSRGAAIHPSFTTRRGGANDAVQIDSAVDRRFNTQLIGEYTIFDARSVGKNATMMKQ